jgi:hypothetical protein
MTIQSLGNIGERVAKKKELGGQSAWEGRERPGVPSEAWDIWCGNRAVSEHERDKLQEVNGSGFHCSNERERERERERDQQ